MIARIKYIKPNTFEIHPGDYGITIRDDTDTVIKMLKWARDNVALYITLLNDGSLSIIPIQGMEIINTGHIDQCCVQCEALD